MMSPEGIEGLGSVARVGADTETQELQFQCRRPAWCRNIHRKALPVKDLGNSARSLPISWPSQLVAEMQPILI
jgi:hypothetical protein